MKKLIIASLATAGILTYFFSRKKTPVNNNVEPHEQTHHLTQVFSKAKQHAVNS